MKSNIIKFKDHEKWYEEDLVIGPNIISIDFNNLFVFKGTLDLTNSTLKEIDLKKIRWIENIINPYNIPIIGLEVIWSNYIKGNTPKLDWFKDKEKPLIYLGGKIDDFHELRYEQERELLSTNKLRVYNPVGVITYPDEAANEFNKLPGELDLKAIDMADYLFYDLQQVSEGTRAEFGYSIGRNYHKTKKIYLLVPEENDNCLTLALQQHCTIVRDIKEIHDLIEYSEKLKKIREIDFKWWKKDSNYLKINKEYNIKWKEKFVKIYETNTKNIIKLMDLIEFKYEHNFDFYNLLLSINCEILEYLESNNEEEIADIFILSTLLYKTLKIQQDYNIDFNKVDNSTLKLAPLEHQNLFEYLPKLILWGSGVGELIVKKINFNNKRLDHK